MQKDKLYLNQQKVYKDLQIQYNNNIQIKLNNKENYQLIILMIKMNKYLEMMNLYNKQLQLIKSQNKNDY